MSLIRRLAADTPPKRVPSAAERRFCNITAANCPVRMDGGFEPGHATTDDF